MPRPKLSHKNAYLKRAKLRFLEGTNCSSPVKAVEAGIRSLSDWAVVLHDELEFDKITREENSTVRRKERRLERRMATKPTRTIN
jgi:hypothetical protein